MGIDAVDASYRARRDPCGHLKIRVLPTSTIMLSKGNMVVLSQFQPPNLVHLECARGSICSCLSESYPPFGMPEIDPVCPEHGAHKQMGETYVLSQDL